VFEPGEHAGGADGQGRKFFGARFIWHWRTLMEPIRKLRLGEWFSRRQTCKDGEMFSRKSLSVDGGENG
jgi:hypothetical protein